MTDFTDSDVIVIGGGAAGMFSACLLAKAGKRVIIIEPNRKLGRKLRITGKGRCNLTNNSSNDNIIKNIVRNPKFMYSALSSFSAADVMDWFETRGVKLKTERGARVFPVSDNANDIADAMEKELRRYRAVVVKDKALRILAENGRAVGVECADRDYYAENVILSTGGSSYPATGSTGDGYSMAKKLGHTVTEISASLVPIVCRESFVADLSGLALKNVTLSLYDIRKRKPVYSELGELSFMPYGIAGPLSLTASCYMNREKLEAGEYRIAIDLKPGLTEEQLERRIQRDFSETPSCEISKAMSRLMPLQMISTFIGLADIAPNKPCNQVTHEERERIKRLFKRFELTPLRLRPIDEAIITRGGVSVKEINSASMESKLVKGVYFAGEIIDVDALTGGYNLQIAFSTAYAAAKAICEYKGD